MIFPNFYQSDDDDELQAETNHAGQPAVDWCHEIHYHQLESSYQPIQSIRNSFHIIGSQQSISCDDEVEKKEEFLEKVEDEEPSPERVEVIKDTLAKKYDDIFIEYNPIIRAYQNYKRTSLQYMMSPPVHMIMKMREKFFLKRILSLINWRKK